jgi:hypothetical protein
MKERYRLFDRNGVFYREDTVTGVQKSLKTRDERTAKRLLNAYNEVHVQPAVSLQMAQAYLSAADPKMAQRTWTTVTETIMAQKTGPTRARWERAVKDSAFAVIEDLPLVQTLSDHFHEVLTKGTVATNVFLRRMHNFALDMAWLPRPVLPKRQWPKVTFGEKRAITLDEHCRVIGAERNPERRAFYELCWHLGGSQTDVASLHAGDIDWKDSTISPKNFRCIRHTDLSTSNLRVKKCFSSPG